MSITSEVGDFEEIDTDKLVAVIKARPVIYDITLKEHHNQSEIYAHWKEVASEMNLPASQCKAKWTNLRSSYNRYLRELKKLRNSGKSTRTKKKWHLADIMSFMKPHLGAKKTSARNLSSAGDMSDIASNSSCNDEHQREQPECTIQEFIRDIPTDNNSETDPFRKSKISAMDLVAEPMVAFLKSRTQKVVVEEDCLLLFLKSLHSDLKRLSAKRQRRFKSIVLHELNSLLEEEEEEGMRLSSASSDITVQLTPKNLPSTSSNLF